MPAPRPALHRLLLLAILCALPGAGPALAGPGAWARLDPLFRARHGLADPAAAPGGPSAPLAARPSASPLAGFPADTLLRGIAEFRGQAADLAALGCATGASAGGLFTVCAPRAALERLLDDPRLVRFEMGRPLELESSRGPAARPASVVLPASQESPLDGRGVLLGFVDSGIEIPHPAFLDSLGASRLVAVWDQYGPGPPPAGYGYGTLWTREDLVAGRAVERDYRGHGTHVAGIAGGGERGVDGALLHFPGVAPRADLAMVRTTYLDEFAAQNVHVVDGVAFLFALASARGQDAVVNLSLGSTHGPHDGSTLTERLLSALTGPGRVLVVSAGNDADRGLHTRLGATGGRVSESHFTIPDYTPFPGGRGSNAVVLEGWSFAPRGGAVSVVSPGGVTFGPVGPGAEGNFTSAEGDVSIFNGVDRSALPDSTGGTGRTWFAISVSDRTTTAHAPAAGRWTVRVTADLPAPLFDLYIDTAGFTSISPMPGFGTEADASRTLTAPGTCDSCITVGGFCGRLEWENAAGGVSSYAKAGLGAPALGDLYAPSGRGPRLGEGLQRPDLVAWGQGVPSARSLDAYFDPWRLFGDEHHVVLEGTSMAAPEAAGAAAEVLQLRPHWGPAEVRQALRRAATATAFSGALPNTAWGYGALDLRAIPAAVADTVLGPADGPLRLDRAANPSRWPVRFTLRARAGAPAARFEVFGVDGRRLARRELGVVPPGALRLAWGEDPAEPRPAAGVYFARVTSSAGTALQRVVLIP